MLALIGLCAACGGGGSDAGPIADAGPVDAETDAEVDAGADAEVAISNGGCTGELELCDIREQPCQLLIAEEVGCLRDREPVLPPVMLITEDEYVALLDTDDDPGIDTVTKHWLNGLALFDLARTGTTDDSRDESHASLVGAVYLNATQEIMIIHRGMPLDDVDTVVTLAHELVHAQQDAEHELMAWTAQHAQTDDRTLAVSGVVEGEAVLFHTLVWNALHSVPVDGFDWDALWASNQADWYEFFDEAESAYETAMLVAPYSFGAAFVTDAWLKDGQDGIDALFEAPPTSMRQVLFGDNDGEAEARTALHAAALPTISPDFLPVNYQSIGAFMFRTFLKRHGASDETALRAAEMLGADVFAVTIRRTDAALVATWRLQLLEGSDIDWLTELELGDGIIALLDDGDASQITFVAAPQELLDQTPLYRWDPVPAQP